MIELVTRPGNKEDISNFLPTGNQYKILGKSYTKLRAITYRGKSFKYNLYAVVCTVSRDVSETRSKRFMGQYYLRDETWALPPAAAGLDTKTQAYSCF